MFLELIAPFQVFALFLLVVGQNCRMEQKKKLNYTPSDQILKPKY